MDDKLRGTRAMETKSSRDQFNKQAALYATSPVHRFGPSLPVLVEMAAPEPSDLVLDVAAGTGNTALTLAPQVQKVIGLDLASAMLEQARDRAQAESIRNIEFLSGSAEELPFPDNEFSLVVSRHAPHHFHRLDKFLGEVRRVLKPGGRLVLADQISPSMQTADWVDGWGRIRHPSHFRHRTIPDRREPHDTIRSSLLSHQSCPCDTPFPFGDKHSPAQ